jgi:MinD-like ATPase involved in chromosome partitioning or flagellar assembly
MNPTEKNGNIITFYSFKGGVGRTMALANVAFLTALNGKRVLVMDWDLEAPGLAYYFHGLLDAQAGKALENSPGILDILYQWQTGIANAGNDNELAALQHQFEQGEPFQNCVRNLIEPALLKAHFPEGACLDIIGPGAKTIEAFANLPYEEALAQFSWADFFDQRAGGFALEQLRLWVKQHYDFILIDSRTGLADIAGICTMQIPDTVALCFVLNGQNIDGIVKVAAAIHAKRPGEIAIRAVPMRVSQRDSAESSDAQARALSALRRVTGADGDADTIKKDMKRLAIPLVDHLPFSEILSPFAAKDPRFDVLAQSYLQLAHNLLGSSLGTLAISDELTQQVKQRRLPKTATVEYVMSLAEAEPLRAHEELTQLIKSAEQIVSDGGELDNKYFAALGEVNIKLASDPEIREMESINESGRRMVQILQLQNQHNLAKLHRLVDAIKISGGVPPEIQAKDGDDLP